MPRSPLLVAALAAFFIAGSPSIIAADQSYVCTAQKQDAGREQPDMSSPLYWWDDGRLRMAEKDQEAYYHGPNPSGDGVTWLDIYAVPNGHGNTFLGYYLKGHFKCAPA